MLWKASTFFSFSCHLRWPLMSCTVIESTSFQTGNPKLLLKPTPRTDESEANCRWSVGPSKKKELLGSLETCNEGTPEEGLLCGQECVPFDEWCTTGTKVSAVEVENLASPLP